MFSNSLSESEFVYVFRIHSNVQFFTRRSYPHPKRVRTQMRISAYMLASVRIPLAKMDLTFRKKKYYRHAYRRIL